MLNYDRQDSSDQSINRAWPFLILFDPETPLFQKQWPLYWSEEERGEFAAYIAVFPSAGDVVPHSGGIRKVR
ncbi:MAG: hypothetical protein Q7R89_02390, partial [bacterium]|nr:hypothetical protein [bacterium]